MGGPESRASAFRPASTTARSSAGRLITVAQTNKARLERLGRRAVAVAVAPVIGVHEDAKSPSPQPSADSLYMKCRGHTVQRQVGSQAIPGLSGLIRSGDVLGRNFAPPALAGGGDKDAAERPIGLQT